MSPRPLTVDDVLDLLPIVAYRGWVVRRGVIRASAPRARAYLADCPVCALNAEVEPDSDLTLEYNLAALNLDIPSAVAQRIARAADDREAPLRARLCAALGLPNDSTGGDA